jgi:membrane peptidoglycan carboxypeptidase
LIDLGTREEKITPMAPATQWSTADSDTGHHLDTHPQAPPGTVQAALSANAPAVARRTTKRVSSKPPQQMRKRRRWLRYTLLAIGLCLAISVGRVIQQELLTSTHQARYLAALARQLTFHVASGPSPSIRYPTTGPYNRRLGYTKLPTFLERLMAGAFIFKAQARLSPRLQQIIDAGLFPIYREKTQAGLHILDRHGETLFAAQYPQRVYPVFNAIPNLVVKTLLFLENRELLNPNYPHRNPAVEWDRFGKALVDRLVQVIDKDHHGAGGSTLATQIEKFRHSPEGITVSEMEKLRQMASASIRAYLMGERTLGAQRQIVLDYINSIPLAAVRGYGEIHGLGDGLWAWYGTDFADANQSLSASSARRTNNTLQAQALAYKQVLSLFIAHRRPSHYLLDDPAALLAHTNLYLNMLSAAGLISPALRDAALPLALSVHQHATPATDASFAAHKGVNLIRTDLLTRLGLPGLYDLDRLDLVVQSTLDKTAQEKVAHHLRQLQNPAYITEQGLRGKGLIGEHADPSKVHYSLVLYERGAQSNLRRIHTDNVDQPFDINTGVKLDLGSTAKLRTLITYLQVVASLHDAYANLPPTVLNDIRIPGSDRLTRWGIDYLKQSPHATLPDMLEAAMSRAYSANPNSHFFTGGGVHIFANFNHRDDDRILSVHEAFRRSVNLVFIRMMQDIVNYHMFRVSGSTAQLLEDRRHPGRQLYLSRFADHEGQIFIERFYRKYAGQSPADIVQNLLEDIHPTPQRLAAIFGALTPAATTTAFTEFLHANLPYPVSEHEIQALYKQHIVDGFSWADRGYLARLHPLDLWVAAYLYQHPEADEQTLITASRQVRQQVYEWLFHTRYKHAQDQRIRTMLEIEAFLEIHKAWQHLGYPFTSLVPSYATAIGSSADRPDALAELMGIIANDGIRLPHERIIQLHFAANTPYDTTMTPLPVAERVLAPEIAAVVKQALFDVAERGTARRIRGAFKQPDGSPMRVGGKTGTGDNRYKRYGPNATLIDAQAVSRTAVFMFLIDNRFFGTLTAYVTGADAAQYHFTSALPVQILKTLAPTLQPLFYEQAWSQVATATDPLP